MIGLVASAAIPIQPQERLLNASLDENALPATAQEASLFNMAYVSRAKPGLGADEVGRIAARSSEWNARHGVTGLLVLGTGLFFQWVEGPRDELEGLMGRIEADPRHEGVTFLSRLAESRERMFPEWGMELVEPSDIEELLETTLSQTADEGNAKALRLLLSELAAGALVGMGKG